MTSDTLLTLRGAPDQQASVYNTYLPKATRIRADQMLPSASIIAQTSKLVTQAQSALISLQDACNSAEIAIRARVATPDADISEASTAKVTWALDHNLQITDICQLLVGDNDRDGFLALKKLLPWVAKMGANETTQSRQAGRDLERLTSIVTRFEEQLLTDAQKRLRDEAREVDISMNLLRQNFTVLLGFFEQQLLPTAVAGMFTRVEKLWMWQGLPNDGTPKGSINLGDDFGGAYKAKGTPGMTSTAPYTPGPLDTYISQQKH
jgi:hypothetical protein